MTRFLMQKSRRTVSVLALVIASFVFLMAQDSPSGLRIISSSSTTSLTQYGITWTFSDQVEYGQYVNGDYWVVGPVEIVEITPASTVVDGRVINGSMVNPPAGELVQGYDQRVRNYVASSNVGQGISATDPLALQVGDSLVSAIGNLAISDNHTPRLRTAAILTVVSSPPSQPSFRPSYAGQKKITHSADDVDYARLRALTPPASVPSYAEVSRWFERPWLDHVRGWSGGEIHPLENLPGYGREIANRVGVGSLMIHLDYDLQLKKPIVLGLIQVGIDNYGIVDNGGTGTWYPDGGHASGRLWPILFAGLMLNDADMQNIGQRSGEYAYSGSHHPGNLPSDYVHFGETSQAFYVSEFDINHYRADGKTGYDPADEGLPEWGIRHAPEPEQDSRSWDANYRTCCTAIAWNGSILASYLMDADSLWNSSALLDYQDRYMQLTAQSSYPDKWHRSWSRFTETMWDEYRGEGPPTWNALSVPGSLDF